MPRARSARGRAGAERRRAALRSGAALALLGAALPANALVTALSLLRPRRAGDLSPRGHREGPSAVGERLTVLVSGGKMTKALVLARAFHRAGHRVVLLETSKYHLTGHRFSRDVDVFRTVPGTADEDYPQRLLDVVREEGVDVYVPVCSPASSVHDARAKAVLEPHCRVLHGDPEQIALVDDKHAFAEAAAGLGLAVPRTHRVTTPEQVLDLDLAATGVPWILKSIAYDPVRRMDLTRLPRPTAAETEAFVRALPITPDNPWILQEFVEGQEYCAHSTVRDGEVTVYVCCPSSGFQVNYAGVDEPGVENLVRRFVSGLGLTGQYSFDLIRRPGGEVVAIECNPRTHSAITLLADHPGLAEAYLGATAPSQVVRPSTDARPTYWLYHEAWRVLRHPSTLPHGVRTVLAGRDAIYDRADPLPFLAVHHLQVPSLLLGSLRHRTPWARIDFNIGKLVEPAGD